MIITLFIIFLLISTVYLLEDYLGSYKKYVYITIGAVLIALAATRVVGNDRDSENYEYTYKYTNDPVNEKTVEFSFLWIAGLLNSVTDDVHAIFLVFALISIPLKLFSITKLSPVWFSSLAIYLSNYYILHELTQIRAGVAAAFFLLAIYWYVNKHTGKAALFITLAVFFHYSSVILFPLLLISREGMDFKWKIIWGAVIPVAYLLHFMHIGLTTIPLPYISDKIEIYTEMRDRGIMGDEAINVFNAVFLIKVMVFYYLWYFQETITYVNKAFPFMLKVYCISLFSFIVLADMPVFAFRISEIFGIVEIILFSNIYFTVKPAYISRSIVITIGFLFLIFNIFQNELLLS